MSSLGCSWFPLSGLDVKAGIIEALRLSFAAASPMFASRLFLIQWAVLLHATPSHRTCGSVDRKSVV